MLRMSLTDGVKAIGQVPYEIAVGLPCRFLDFPTRGVGRAVCDIVVYRARKQDWILKDNAYAITP